MRPISVTLIALLYLAVGVIGFAAHFHSLLSRQPYAWAIELTEFLAVIVAIFLFRRRNWARWLAVVWMGFHVAISLREPIPLAIHSAFFVVIAWGLFHPSASRWFRRTDGVSPPVNC